LLKKSPCSIVNSGSHSRWSWWQVIVLAAHGGKMTNYGIS